LSLLRKILLAGMVLLSIVPVSACGKKPVAVDPPLGSEESGFPHVYPKPGANN